MSINVYFDERCSTGNNFWKTVRPFISDKMRTPNSCVTLCDNETVVNDPSQVCDVFNEYFISMTANMGLPDAAKYDDLEDIIDNFSDHESIKLIKDAMPPGFKHFSFSCVSETDTMKRLLSLNTRKATGCDGLQPTFIKMGAPVMARHISVLINKSIERSVFPDGLKHAEVTPVFKKSDSLNKANYRSVSLLPTISQIYERVLSDQLVDYFISMVSYQNI